MADLGSPTNSGFAVLSRRRYGSIGGGASETLRDLVGKKIVGDFDAADGIMGLGTF